MPPRKKVHAEQIGDRSLAADPQDDDVDEFIVSSAKRGERHANAARGLGEDARAAGSSLRRAAAAAAFDDDERYAGSAVPVDTLRETQGLYPSSSHDDDGDGGDSDEDDDEVAYTDEVTEPEQLTKDGSAPRPQQSSLASSRHFADDVDAELAALEAGDAAPALQLMSGSKEGDEGPAVASALRQQLALYESALEARIRMQPLLVDSNRLPSGPDLAAASRSSGDTRARLLEARNAMAAIAIDLCRLQHALAVSLPKGTVDEPAGRAGTKRRRVHDDNGDDDDDGMVQLPALLPEGVAPLGSKRARTQLVDDSDLPRDMRQGPQDRVSVLDASHVTSAELWRAVTANEAAIQRWRNAAINDLGRKLAYTGNMSSKQASKLRVAQKDITTQVEEIMQDADRVIARSRPLAADVHVLCSTAKHAAGARLMDAYDDSDFYHQLLKDFIASGSTMGAAGNTARSHPSKKREGIDQRATKGRRLKFTVQPKLVNFTAPVPFVVPPEMSFDLDTVVASLFKAS